MNVSGPFDMFYAVKSSEVKLILKLKTRTEFPNVWGEYKNHSNPYTHSTTVLCDIGNVIQTEPDNR